MFEATRADGVLQLARPDVRWLSTGFDGGFVRADAAYNVSVPEGWDRRDLAAYAAARRDRAGFDVPGPTLLTGVDLEHARGARLDPVVAYATVGLSNPAALPIEPDGVGNSRTDESRTDDGRTGDSMSGDSRTDESRTDDGRTGDSMSGDETGDPPQTGTVNVLLGTTRALGEAPLANLATVVAEAKAATLLELAGYPGTTTDAVVVASDANGDVVPFSGSSTEVGAAARACVREAVRASFESRYGSDGGGEGAGVPPTVAAADHGVVTDERAAVFEP